MILVLDFDGTVIRGVSWRHVMDFYGVRPEPWLQRYLNGEVTMEQWIRRDIGELMKHYSERDLDRIEGMLEYTEGFREFARKYFPKFRKVVFLSGGFPPLVKRIAEKWGAQAETIEYELEGGEVRVKREIDGNAKREILERLAKEDRVVYVADHVPGYEPEWSHDRILRIDMEGEHCRDRVHHHFIRSFHELAGVIEALL